MNGHGVAFELREVSKRYGARSVLSDCSLSLPESESTALLGVSGCGKSTVLRLLGGLEAPTRGEILINGSPASCPGRILVPPHRRRLAMVFQDLGLWPALNVFDNVLLGLDGCRLPPVERRSRATAALQLCRVGELAARMPGTLSGGQQQRVALARALAPDPLFLLLDEPFAGLDLATKMELLADMKAVLSARRLSLCLVTHDPTEAFALSTHGVVLDQGRVSEHGPWEEILRAPRAALLQAFRNSYDTAMLARSSDALPISRPSPAGTVGA